MGDAVGIDVEAITGGQNITDHRVDKAEQCLVLQLLVAEPYQRLERNLVAEPVILAQFQDLGIDEALDQTKDIGVGAALYLTDEPHFIGRQGRERIRQRKPVWKKLVGGIETAPPDHILVDVPTNPLGRLNAACVPFATVRDIADHVHFSLLSRSGAPMAQTNRSADAAIFRSLDGRGSMTSPPGDMTETPYRGGRIGSGWRRSAKARRSHHGARISGVQTRRKADFVDTRRTCQYRTKFLGTRSSCDGPGALFPMEMSSSTPVASATCRFALRQPALSTHKRGQASWVFGWGSDVSSLVRTIGLYKRYISGETSVCAVSGVSFVIEQGEFVAIRGRSGSGKSTLMHLLGLLERPDSGEYALKGRDVAQLSEDARATIRSRDIGFVFQLPALLPRATALENVELPLVYASVPRLRRRRTAMDVLARVGLAGRSHHWPNQLSGGEQQRVVIARAMVNDPAVILADEPPGSLDSSTSEGILSLFDDLHRDGRTLIVVTHATEVAGRAQRRITLHDGRIIDDDGAACERAPSSVIGSRA